MSSRPIPRDEVIDILRLFKTLRRGNLTPLIQVYQQIADVTGYDMATIAALIRRHQPTIDHARMILAAGTARMAKRLVAKANTSEIIDIFQRPNIGLLAPKAASEGHGGGFFLSVESNSLGGVKVAVAQGAPKAPASLLPLTSNSEEGEEELSPDERALSARGEYLRLRRERLGPAPVEAVPEPVPEPFNLSEGWQEAPVVLEVEEMTAATTVMKSEHSRKALADAQERLNTPPLHGRRNNYHRKPPARPRKKKVEP